MESVPRLWPHFQFTNGKIHDLDIENYENQWNDVVNKYAFRISLIHSKWKTYTYA
jgi:hypothetical protein